VPALRFAPAAWAKLRHWRDAGPTEIGGFGITRPDDPLCVDDIGLIRQNCTAVSVQFEDDAVAEWFDAQVDLGRRPAEFARIWIHTHPGDSPWPSSIDELTFERVFGNCDWAVMFILARGGDVYARLQLRIGAGGPQITLRLPVRIDWDRPLTPGDPVVWEAEYAACVRSQEWPPPMEREFDVPTADWRLPDDLLAWAPEAGL
jgi:proteasome lid subunit RPN8/RPN11